MHRERMQVLTRRTAFDAGSWGAEEARLVAEMFDLRAGSWDEGRGPEYLEPLADALARGGVPRGGVCVEIGSGTGLQTPTLALHFDQVVSVDISAEMLTRARRGPARLVQADASRLPLASGSAGAIVCVNAFLFPGEYLRVLAPTGRVVYVSTRGERTPIYLAPSEVFAALGQARGCPISAVTSGTGAASWTVAALSRGAREGDPPPAVVPRPGGLTR